MQGLVANSAKVYVRNLDFSFNLKLEMNNTATKLQYMDGDSNPTAKCSPQNDEIEKENLTHVSGLIFAYIVAWSIWPLLFTAAW